MKTAKNKWLRGIVLAVISLFALSLSGGGAMAGAPSPYSLFWDFENIRSAGTISTAQGASSDPTVVTGLAFQTGGGPAENFGSMVHLTRPFTPSTYPYIEFTITTPVTVESLTFAHYHNHIYGFPTFPSYDVQLQLQTETGFTDIGSPLTLAPANNGMTDTMALGSVSLEPGTHQLRWVPKNLSWWFNIGTEYFALDNTTLVLSGSSRSIEVAIDIQPGEDPNTVNTKSNGAIPVAILSTADFDATTAADPGSLTFGATGDEASLQLRGKDHAFPDCSQTDVNGDGLIDLLCHFETQKTGFQSGSTEGILKGSTGDGSTIIGRNAVHIVGEELP